MTTQTTYCQAVGGEETFRRLALPPRLAAPLRQYVTMAARALTNRPE